MAQTLIIATIKWATCGEDLDINQLPPQFVEAKRLGVSDDPKDIETACNLVAPFVKCSFVTDNVDGDLSEILTIEDEIYADEVILSGVDFSESDLPSIKAHGFFLVESVGKFSKSKFTRWQEDNDMLDNGITFYWDFGNPESEHDLNLVIHSGLGVEVVDPNKPKK